VGPYGWEVNDPSSIIIFHKETRKAQKENVSFRLGGEFEYKLLGQLEHRKKLGTICRGGSAKEEYPSQRPGRTLSPDVPDPSEERGTCGR